VKIIKNGSAENFVYIWPFYSSGDITQ